MALTVPLTACVEGKLETVAETEGVPLIVTEGVPLIVALTAGVPEMLTLGVPLIETEVWGLLIATVPEIGIGLPTSLLISVEDGKLLTWIEVGWLLTATVPETVTEERASPTRETGTGEVLSPLALMATWRMPFESVRSVRVLPDAVSPVRMRDMGD